MLSALPLWLALNFYAFLLDAVAGALAAGAWFLFSYGYRIPGWGVVVVAAIFLYFGIRVHISYPVKLKTYNVLYRRNCKTFHRSSFHEFMGAPCYRLVVLLVLCRIGRQEEYKSIYKDVWGTGLTCCSIQPATVKIFNDPAESRLWLEKNKKELDAGDSNS